MNRGLWIVLLNALMRTENGNWPAMPEPAAASLAQEAAQPSADGGQASAVLSDGVDGGTGGMVDQTVSQQLVELPEAVGDAEEAAAGAGAEVPAGDGDAAFYAALVGSDVDSTVDHAGGSDELRTPGHDGLSTATVVS